MSERIGSVEQMASGRWRVRMRLTGVGRKTIDTFNTHGEAEAYRGTMTSILEQDEQDDGITLLQLGESVLTKRELSGLISDAGTDWSRWNNHVKPDPIAQISVRSVRDTHVEDWLERLLAKRLSRQTRLHCLNLLRVVMRTAKKKRLIKENPCLGIRLEIEKRTEDPWTFATSDEQDALIASTPKPLEAIVEFAIGTGLRSGELVSLRLADVHLDGPDPYITVRYGGPPSKPTKWGRIRQVPLFGRGLAGLQRWLEALPQYAKHNPHGLVFPAQRGGFRNHDHVFRWSLWKGAPARGKSGDRNYHAPIVGIVERAGIKRGFRWHDLRHTCASSLVSGLWGGRRWSLKEVCDLLGHRSVTTTERYAHLADTALKRAARETGNDVGPRLVHTMSNSTKSFDIPTASQAEGRGFETRVPLIEIVEEFEVAFSGVEHAWNTASAPAGTTSDSAKTRAWAAIVSRAALLRMVRVAVCGRLDRCGPGTQLTRTPSSSR
jgi:integrase